MINCLKRFLEVNEDPACKFFSSITFFDTVNKIYNSMDSRRILREAKFFWDKGFLGQLRILLICYGLSSLVFSPILEKRERVYSRRILVIDWDNFCKANLLRKYSSGKWYIKNDWKMFDYIIFKQSWDFDRNAIWSCWSVRLKAWNFLDYFFFCAKWDKKPNIG